ncbi:expressed unknown protein [Seminavis robusta]|uniref:HNH nuclease domain-containing protein n=1 Tax=Seminavis robusta TaxID=568900 RepID=A0A9N8HM81_9STRA|nr:expressed unknown protein [Seminavis robusta]|eukprot:Sro725_g193400.1 n/a (483) ;mRNA; f:47831-49279
MGNCVNRTGPHHWSGTGGLELQVAAVKEAQKEIRVAQQEIQDAEKGLLEETDQERKEIYRAKLRRAQHQREAAQDLLHRHLRMANARDMIQLIEESVNVQRREIESLEQDLANQQAAEIPDKERQETIVKTLNQKKMELSNNVKRQQQFYSVVHENLHVQAKIGARVDDTPNDTTTTHGDNDVLATNDQKTTQAQTKHETQRYTSTDNRDQEEFHNTEPNPDQRESPDISIADKQRVKDDHDLRARVAEYHGFSERETESKIVLARCCVTQVVGDEDQVLMTHLIPRGSRTPILEFLGINNLPNGIDNFGNLILLVKNIKLAYDAQRLCFVMNSAEEDPASIVLKILDPLLEKEPIYDGATATIGMFDGSPLLFDERKVPLTRVLSMHARLAYSGAKDKKWIPKDAVLPEEFGSPLANDTIVVMSSKSRRGRQKRRKGKRDKDCHQFETVEAVPSSKMVRERRKRASFKSLTTSREFTDLLF